MSLVCLHAYMCACSVVHVTRICCFEFRYLEFSFGYLENSLLRISLSRIFEKDREFFALNPTKNLSKIQRLFMENSREQRTNFDEFCLHYFCTILYKELLKRKYVMHTKPDNSAYTGKIQRMLSSFQILPD